MKPLLFCILLVALGVAEANDENPGGKVAPLFAADDVLDVTITAPIGEIMETRSLEEETPGTFAYRDAESGEQVALDIGIRTRGRFRHDPRTCPFAPLRLNFKKTKGTLLAKSDKMKLVTHCRTGSNRYEQALLKEYIAYRILNIITDWSFRVRLLRIRYVDGGNEGEAIESYAILIEHRKQLAKRLGMKVDDSEATTIAALDGAHTNLVSIFQFLIGNTDFSPIKGVPGERCCHNHVLLKNDSTQISVPYDFDISGIVSPPHARPNPRFNLNSVKQRLYRGRCANNGHLEKSLETYRDRREAIYGLIANLDAMSKMEKTKTTRYVEDFYKVIDKPRLLKRDVVKGCLGP
jgi:hypothetical protein